MVSRMVLAGLGALCAVGSLVAPLSAKGAFGGRAGFAFHSAIHAHGVLVRPAHGRALAVGHRRFRLRQGRNFGAAFGGAWLAPAWDGFDDIGPYDGGAYYPAADTDAGTTAPAAAAVENGTLRSVRPIAVYRPGCRTQTQTVPSEAGGTSTVNIIRCY